MSEPPGSPSESFGSAPDSSTPASPPPSPPPTYPPAPPPPPPAQTPIGGAPVGAPIPGYANSDEKTWALVAHFGGAAGAFLGAGGGGWIAPLIALVVKGNESPTVRAHAVAALNFQLLCT